MFFSQYRNYFESKATSAQTVSTAFYALRGLKSQNDQVFLNSNDNKGGLKFIYDVISPLGQPATIKSIISAQLVSTKSGAAVKLTDKVTLDDGKKITVDLEKEDKTKFYDSNIISFEIEGAAGSKIFVNKTFDMKLTLAKVKSVKVSQNNKKTLPQHYQFEKGYPRDFNALNTNDHPYLHMEIEASFEGVDLSVLQPASVYITLWRDDEMIAYSKHAKYNATTKLYNVQSDLRKQMKEQINGDYNMVLHVNDPRADKALEKKLGVLQINFNEGSQEGTNMGIREDYQLYETIINYFPPEPEAPSPVFPMAFTGLILLMFFWFFSQLFQNGANLGNLSFSGLLFLLNFAVILLILIFFWFGQFGPFKLNLVITLWLLAAATPITLLTMNYGLTPENCFVSPFQKVSGSGKGKKD